MYAIDDPGPVPGFTSAGHPDLVDGADRFLGVGHAQSFACGAAADHGGHRHVNGGSLSRVDDYLPGDPRVVGDQDDPLGQDELWFSQLHGQQVGRVPALV
jgi:hypothetical protein